METPSGSEIMMMAFVAAGAAAIGYWLYHQIPSLQEYNWAVYGFPIAGFALGVVIDIFYFNSTKSKNSEYEPML